MAYSTVGVHDFPALDTRSAQDDAGCIDLQNIDLDRPGQIRVRDGFEHFADTDGAAIHELFPFYTSGGTQQLLVVQRNIAWTPKVRALNTSGTEIAEVNTGAVNITRRHTFARFAAPGAEYVYIGEGTGGIRRWDGATFSSPAGMPSAQFLAIQQPGNRLVAAGGNTVTARSRVNFSDPGAPETWGSTNYVDVTPGDGDQIRGICSHGTLTIVFKSTKFFVFYGNSTDATGNPVFNVRTVDTGIGCACDQQPVSTPHGVFFLGPDGVYLTDGGAPTRVSQPVDKDWNIHPGTTPHFAWFKDRLHYGGYVFDPRTNAWSYWTITSGINGVTPFRTSVSLPEQLYVSNGSDILKQTSGVTTDNGLAIVSHYRTGFRDFGTEDEKRIVETRVFGTGAPTIKFSRDFNSTLSTGEAVTLGTSPAVDQDTAECDVDDGRLWSVQIGASSGAWTVQRLTHYVDGLRPPATHTP